MSNCNDCVRLNPLPECIDTDEFLLTGITFPDYPSSTIYAMVEDTATQKNTQIDIAVDGSGVPAFDIAELYTLDDHNYKISFIASNGTPANFLLTNPNGSIETGCCVEFKIILGLTASDTWVLSSQSCNTSSSSDSPAAARVYRAILSQASINDPITVTVLENSIGAIVWTQPTPDLAHYNATLTGAFLTAKTFLMSSIDVQNANAYWSTMGWNSEDQLHLELWDEINVNAPTTSATASMGTNGVFVQILVYP